MRVDLNQIRMTGENSFLRLGKFEDSALSYKTVTGEFCFRLRVPGTSSLQRANSPTTRSRSTQTARWLQEGIQASMTPLYSGNEVPDLVRLSRNFRSSKPSQ